MEEKAIKKNASNLPEGVTSEQVKAWKERYGENKIHACTLLDPDTGDEMVTIVARTPGRKEVGEFEKWVDKNPDKSKEILVNSCVLSHKDEVKNDEKKFMAAFDAIMQVYPIGRAQVKNL
jgi:hypothetical protein